MFGAFFFLSFPVGFLVILFQNIKHKTSNFHRMMMNYDLRYDGNYTAVDIFVRVHPLLNIRI